MLQDWISEEVFVNLWRAGSARGTETGLSYLWPARGISGVIGFGFQPRSSGGCSLQRDFRIFRVEGTTS